MIGTKNIGSKYAVCLSNAMGYPVAPGYNRVLAVGSLEDMESLYKKIREHKDSFSIEHLNLFEKDTLRKSILFCKMQIDPDEWYTIAMFPKDDLDELLELLD